MTPAEPAAAALMAAEAGVPYDAGQDNPSPHS